MKLWIKDLHGSFRAYVKRRDITIFAEAESREKAVRLVIVAMQTLKEAL